MGFVIGPNGGTFPCGVARHLADPAAHSLFETIARLTQLGECEQQNRKGRQTDPEAEFMRGDLRAPLRTLAEASGMSVNWVKKHLATLVAKGLLLPNQRERRNGKLMRQEYEVLTHYELALRDGCPSCRFDKHGGLTRRRASSDVACRFAGKLSTDLQAAA